MTKSRNNNFWNLFHWNWEQVKKSQQYRFVYANWIMNERETCDYENEKNKKKEEKKNELSK